MKHSFTFNGVLKSFIIAVGLLSPLGVNGQSTTFTGHCVSMNKSASEGTVFTVIDPQSSSGYGQDLHCHYRYCDGVEASSSYPLGSVDYGAVWRHNQIPIEMVICPWKIYYYTYDDNGDPKDQLSHDVTLNDKGKVNPTVYTEEYEHIPSYENCISTTKLDGGIVVCYPYDSYSGSPEMCLCVSLPVGYRFTGYEIKLRPVSTLEVDTLGVDKESWNVNGEENYVYWNEDLDYTFCEVGTTETEAGDTIIDCNGTAWNTTKLGTIESPKEGKLNSEDRTGAAQWSNNLYFVLKADGENEDAAGIKAVVIEEAKFYYECEPLDFVTLSDNSDYGNIDGSQTTFDTGWTNLGKLYYSGGNYGCDIRQSDDGTNKGIFNMKSAVAFYDPSEVIDGVPSTAESSSTDANISVGEVSAADGALFTLNTGTYYVETAAAASDYLMTAASARSKYLVAGNYDASLPAGYRITGLKLTEKFGGYNIKLGAGYLGSAEVQYYHDSSRSLGNFYTKSSTATTWHKDTSGHLYTYYNGNVKTLCIIKGSDLNDALYGDEYHNFVTGQTIDDDAYYVTEMLSISETEVEVKDKYEELNTIEAKFNISANGVLTTTIDGVNYYVNYDTDGVFAAMLVKYGDDIPTTSGATYQNNVSATNNDEWGGTKVEVFTNSDTSPLVTLIAKKKDDETFTFALTDETSLATVDTNTSEEYSFTIANAKDYINNDAIKIVVSDATNPDSHVDGKYAALNLSVQVEPLDPFISKVLVDDEYGINETKTANIVGTQIDSDITVAVRESIDTGANLKFTALHEQNLLDLSNYDGNSAGTGYSLYGLVNSSKYSDDDRATYSSSDAVSDYISTYNLPQSQFKYNNLADITEEGAYLNQNLFLTTGVDSLGYVNLISHDNDADSKTYYLVSYDQPAFNLSPATALRHQSYAYYSGTVKSEVATEYTPKLTFTPIYNETFHDDAVDNKTYYGATVDVEETYDAETMNVKPYLSAALIGKGIDSAIENGTEGEVPNDTAHILYVDASNLNKLLVGKYDGDVYTNIRKKLAANAFVYVPNISVADTNVVKKTDTNAYEATANVRFIDKQPMFIPTNFTKPSSSTYSVEYVRNFTSSLDNRVSLNTFILPMALPVTSGVYDEKLKIYTMKSEDCLTDVDSDSGNGTNYYKEAAFTLLDDGITETTANTPYFAVTTQSSTTDNEIFTIKLTDEVNIVATGTPDGTVGTAISSDKSSGSVDGKSVYFTPYGTYSGAALDKTKGYFYFGQDKLYSSYNLGSRYPNVLMYPFRVYYDFETSGTTTGSKLNSLAISLLDDSSATGIKTLDAADGRSVIVSTTDGAIVVKALADTNVAVYSTSGQCVSKRNMAVGEVQTIPTAKGLYVVNGQKVIVK